MIWLQNENIRTVNCIACFRSICTLSIYT